MEDSSLSQPEPKDIIWSFLMRKLIFYFQSESNFRKTTRAPVVCHVYHAVLVPAVDCTVIVLISKGKKIQTQINKAKTLSLKQTNKKPKTKLTKARGINRLLDCFVLI